MFCVTVEPYVPVLNPLLVVKIVLLINPDEKVCAAVSAPDSAESKSTCAVITTPVSLPLVSLVAWRSTNCTEVTPVAAALTVV